MRNIQEQVKKAFCYQKLFWPFTVWINCSSDLKNFTNSRPTASNFKSFSRSLEQFFLTVGQKNFDNKIPLFPGSKYSLSCWILTYLFLWSLFVIGGNSRLTLLASVSTSVFTIACKFLFNTNMTWLFSLLEIGNKALCSRVRKFSNQ